MVMMTANETLMGAEHQVIFSNVALPAASRSGGCVGDENGKPTARSPSVHNHSTNCPSPDEERCRTIINALIVSTNVTNTARKRINWLIFFILAFQLHTQRLHNLWKNLIVFFLLKIALGI